MSDCVFCEIVAQRAPARYLAGTADTITIVPLNPVVPGHMITIPRKHVADALEDPISTAVAMRDAVRAANAANLGDCNIITSRGPAATQTVQHLHIHTVPRYPDDGLCLPWTGQAKDGAS